MIPDSPTQASVGLRWTGRIFSGLVVAFLLFDAVGKLVPVRPVFDGLQALGFRSTPELARGLGTLLLVCTGIHVVPRTALLGAVLLTGYLGGTIAVHLRAENPLFSHMLFGGYVGGLLWTGLLLRNRRLWQLFRTQFIGPDAAPSAQNKLPA